MKILAIASAEWLNKKYLFPTALLVGLAIVGAPMLLSRNAGAIHDNQLAAAVAIGFPLTGILGLIFGAGLFAPDIQEGRLGFYLAQPIRSEMLFAGKTLGTILLTFAIGMLVMLPTVLLHLGQDNSWQALLPLTFFAIAAPLVGHALSVAFRARTPWLFLDLAGLLASVLVFIWFMRWMWVLNTFDTLAKVLGGLFMVGLLVLFTAGCLQVAKGRTDLKLGHRWLSSVWAIFPLMAMATMLVTQHRTLNVEAAAIPSVWAATALANGPWAQVTTGVEGPGANLLINTDTGKGLRLGHGLIATSMSGKRGIWLQPPAPGQTRESCEVWALELGPKGYDLRSTGIELTKAYGAMVLDAEGDHVAIIEEQALSVYNVDSGLLRARCAWSPGRSYTQLVFLDADHLRCYVHSMGDNKESALIYDLEIPSGRLKLVGSLRPGRILDRDPKLDSLLMKTFKAGSYELDLVNARSGALIKSLTPDGGAWGLDAAFLRDGSIFIADFGSKGLRVHHLGSGGETLSSMQIQGEFPNSRTQSSYPWIGDEGDPGMVELGFHSAVEHSASLMVEVNLANNAFHPRPRQVERWGFTLVRRMLMGPNGVGSLSGRMRIGNGHVLEIQDPDGQTRRLTAAPMGTR